MTRDSKRLGGAAQSVSPDLGVAAIEPPSFKNAEGVDLFAPLRRLSGVSGVIQAAELAVAAWRSDNPMDPCVAALEDALRNLAGEPVR